MEKFQEAKAKAEKSLKIADHMLFVTYPLIKDNKLLMTILENIFLAFTQSMASVLYYERLFKRIPPFHDSFDGKYNLFKKKIIPKHKLNPKYGDVIMEIKEMVVAHKTSPMEFTRAGKFVICSKNYRLKTLGPDQLKGYIADAKGFIKINNRIVEKNAHIFK